MRPILTTISATVLSMQLTYPVLAHAGELHGRPAQPAEPSTPVDDNGDNSAVESKTPALSPESEINEVTAEATELGTEPPLVAGSPNGLGESLFIILLVFPCLLLALRTKLHLQPRS